MFQLIKDDEARFNAADLDRDGSLDETEYLAYFQPYDFPHMFEVEMEKTMKDFDKDKDGFVSKDEFIGGKSFADQNKTSKVCCYFFPILTT